MEEPKRLITAQEAEAQISARYRTFLILWIAILTSIGIMLVVAVLTTNSAAPNQTLSLALLIAALSAVTISIFVKQRLLSQAIERQQIEKLMSAHIVAFALSESAAVFGLMNHFVTGFQYYCLAFVLAALGMLAHFPKKEHLRAVSQKQF
jgi:F0F1-type ATP synthase membrane subunit c/vacuolar-type H+-ATPase subunit K